MPINRSARSICLALLLATSSSTLYPMHYARNILSLCSRCAHKILTLVRAHPKFSATVALGAISCAIINKIKDQSITRCALSGNALWYKLWHILGARIDPSSDDMRRAFFINVQANRLWLTHQMLNDGTVINDNHVLQDSSSALHEATRLGYTEMADMLVTYGAQKTIRDSHNKIPLHYAAHHNRSAIANTLLASEADRQEQLHAQDIYGYTPLHTAADAGAHNTATILLDAGAQIEATTELRIAATDNTREATHNNGLLRPLHLAAQKGSVPTIQLLLDRGADMQAVDEQDKIPLERARRVWAPSAKFQGRPGVLTLLTPIVVA